MYKIEIEEKMYEVPSGWDEVTLETLLKINNCLLDNNVSKIGLVINLLSSLAGIEKEILFSIKMSDLEKIDFSWLDEPIEKIVENELIIDNKKYKIINFKEISLGEFADLDNYIKNITENLHYVVAILIRPEVDGEIEKYNTKTLDERAKLFFNKMKISQVLGVVDFFQNGVDK